MMQQFMVVNYVHIIMSKKTKIKSAENSWGRHFRVFLDVNGIYVQRFVLYCKINELQRKK